MERAWFTITVGDEQRDIMVFVNESGNLVLSGVGSCTYEMYDDELVLSKYNEEDYRNG